MFWSLTRKDSVTELVLPETAFAHSQNESTFSLQVRITEALHGQKLLSPTPVHFVGTWPTSLLADTTIENNFYFASGLDWSLRCFGLYIRQLIRSWPTCAISCWQYVHCLWPLEATTELQRTRNRISAKTLPASSSY